MKASRLLQALRIFVESCETTGIDYAILGGFALPAYGVIRATIDLDVGLAVTLRDQLRLIVRQLETRGYKFASTPSPAHAMIYAYNPQIFDLEIWLRPDGVVWDRETLQRRLKFEYNDGNKKFEAYVLGPEDFIVNKFARSDRTANDELDATKVYINLRHTIDLAYLERRAKSAKVWDLVSAMRDHADAMKRV